MDRVQKSEYTIYQGSELTVEWYYTKDGKLPGYEYYQTMTQEEKVRFFHIVTYYADTPSGKNLPRTLLNIEDKKNKIYALKPFSRRFFCFTVIGSKLIITNGYRKSSQKMTKKDKEKLKTAITYKEDYLTRTKAGDYYEKE